MVARVLGTYGESECLRVADRGFGGKCIKEPGTGPKTIRHVMSGYVHAKDVAKQRRALSSRP